MPPVNERHWVDQRWANVTFDEHVDHGKPVDATGLHLRRGIRDGLVQKALRNSVEDKGVGSVEGRPGDLAGARGRIASDHRAVPE